MRKLIFVAFVFLGLVGCKTSEKILPIESFETSTIVKKHSNLKNIYFKDVNGVFEKYVGTWSGVQDGKSFELEITAYNAQEEDRDASVFGGIKYDRLLMQYKVTDVSGNILRNTLNHPLEMGNPYTSIGQYFSGEDASVYNMAYVVHKNEDCKYFALMRIGLINNETQLEVIINPNVFKKNNCEEIASNPLFPIEGEPALVLSRI